MEKRTQAWPIKGADAIETIAPARGVTIEIITDGPHGTEIRHPPFWVSPETWSGLCNVVERAMVKARIPGRPPKS